MVTYTCHAGLTEVVAPLNDSGTTIGYIMFGQITNIKSKTEFAQSSRALCEGYEINFDEFDKILENGGAVGKNMDYLLQEMNREVNTTGSKANDADMAHLVVNMKSELEKIREQIQNLE
jgi:hypothetical protein